MVAEPRPRPHVGARGTGIGRRAVTDGGARPRLGAPDARADPAVVRRSSERGPPGEGPGARAPGLALRREGARDDQRGCHDAGRRRRAPPAPHRGRSRDHGPGRAGGRLRAHREPPRPPRCGSRSHGQRRQVVRRPPGLALRRGRAPRRHAVRAGPGPGFDPENVPHDRQGIDQSIKARMARYGGTVVIRSAPGEGTDVELSMPR